MKKIIPLLPFFLTLFLFTQCNNSSTENAETRGKTISELLSNDVYMQEVMDSMEAKHAMSDSIEELIDDKSMQIEKMNKMMEKYKTDSIMFKVMTNKIMDICDTDTAKCKMMLASIKSHPVSMKSLQDMGMCDMKGVNKK